MSLCAGKDKSSLPYSEHDVPDSLTQDNGEVESSHEQAVFDSGLYIHTSSHSQTLKNPNFGVVRVSTYTVLNI